jgi:hypothetical protein
MPVLELEEIGVETAKRRVDLPEDEKRPVICVFDPIAVHAVIFDHALAELRDKIDVLWQAEFSRTLIDMGGISERTYPVLIAVKKPILLFSELEVIPGEGYSWGIEMLQNLRRAGLRDVPLFVISSASCLLKAFEEAGKELEELRVNQYFTWGGLERSPKEQKRLFDLVSQVLGLKT